MLQSTGRHALGQLTKKEPQAWEHGSLRLLRARATLAAPQNSELCSALPLVNGKGTHAGRQAALQLF